MRLLRRQTMSLWKLSGWDRCRWECISAGRVIRVDCVCVCGWNLAHDHLILYWVLLITSPVFAAFFAAANYSDDAAEVEQPSNDAKDYRQHPRGGLCALLSLSIL